MLYPNNKPLQDKYFAENSITHVFIWHDSYAKTWTVHTGNADLCGFEAGSFSRLKDAKKLADDYVSAGLIFYRGNY